MREGQEYVVEQTYHSSDQLTFVYTCQSRKFDADSPEFFFYQLESCSADGVSYKSAPFPLHLLLIP